MQNKRTKGDLVLDIVFYLLIVPFGLYMAYGTMKIMYDRYEKEQAQKEINLALPRYITSEGNGYWDSEQ